MAVRHIIRSQPQSMLVQPISKIMPFILTLESQFDRPESDDLAVGNLKRWGMQAGSKS
jgi:hypothetical protein